MKKILSIILCLTLVLGLACAVSASESGTKYTETTLTSGTYILVDVNGYSPTVFDASNWVLSEQATVSGNTASGAVWTLVVDGENVTLTDANGVSIAPKGGNNNGIASGVYNWKWVCNDDGTYSFYGQGSDTVILAANVGSDNKYRGYKTTTVENNPDGYPINFTLYKVGAEAEPPVEITYDYSATLVTELKDGDEVVIFSVANSSLMTATDYLYVNANNGSEKHELEQLPASLDGNTVKYNDGAVVLTAHVADGKVSFTSADGKYLYADGTHVQFVAEVGENTEFVLEPTEGGYFIKCANAVYYDSKNDVEKPQYLEVYGGYFTCYSMGSNTAIYTFQFYAPVSTNTPEPSTPADPSTPVINPDPTNPKDGDTISVFVALMAVSAVGIAVIGKKKF